MGDMGEKTGTDKVVEFLSKYKEDEKNGNAGWVAAAVALLLTMLMVALMAYRAFKMGKEKAKLLHERDVAEEDAHQAEVDERLGQASSEAEEAIRRAAEARSRLSELETQMKDLEDRRQEVNSKIGELTSWGDIDELLK